MRKDEDIKKDVVDQLYWDDRIDASEVQVTVTNGLVQLTGKVPTNRDRIAAYDDTTFVDGVLDVHNDLEVEFIETLLTDKDIAENAKEALRLDPDVEAFDIEVKCDEGLVELNGNVDAYWKKVLAEETVLNLAGVTAVTNKLVVVPSKKVEDEVIATDIVEALDRSAFTNPEDINVKVEEGVVKLSGNVPSIRAKVEATETARYTPGVVYVHNGNLAVSASA